MPVSLGKLFLLSLLLLSFGLTGTACQDRSDQDMEGPALVEEEAPEQPEQYAPDFTVKDMAGEDVRLSDWIGTPILLNFWTTWCGGCLEELPAFETAYREYGDEIRFLMVDLVDGYQEKEALSRAFIREKGYTFPVYFDSTGETISRYGIYAIPVTVAIDREGKILTTHAGSLDADQLRAVLEMLLRS